MSHVPGSTKKAKHQAKEEDLVTYTFRSFLDMNKNDLSDKFKVKHTK